MDPRPLADAFRTETEPSDIAAARVHARLRASAATPSTAWVRARSFGAGLLVAGVPALLALVVLRGPAPTSGLDPATETPAPASASPSSDAAAPLAAVLEAPGPARDLAASDGVALRFAGFGRLSGTVGAPRIEWAAGRLEVEVEPGRGLDVQVQTREARVRVVGTGFTVERDATGTAIAVSHGRVEVVCDQEPAVFLSTGEQRRCLPVSAAGRLARARALRDAGVAPAAVLDEARAALALAPDDVVADELRFLELELLVELGRVEEARAAGEALLAGPQPARGPAIAALLDRVGADR